MNIIFIVAALIVAAILVGWRMLSSASSKAAPDNSPKTDRLNSEQSALLELALHPGEDGLPLMYALETCRHCRKTREFLEENKVQFHLVYVDQFSGEARSSLMDKVRTFNPRGSFPTVVMPGGKTVVGFREQLLREALLHDSGSAA